MQRRFNSCFFTEWTDRSDPCRSESNRQCVCRIFMPDNYSMNQIIVFHWVLRKTDKIGCGRKKRRKGLLIRRKSIRHYQPFRIINAKLNLENTESAPLYNTVEDAIAGINAIGEIPAGGIRYVSISIGSIQPMDTMSRQNGSGCVPHRLPSRPQH